MTPRLNSHLEFVWWLTVTTSNLETLQYNLAADKNINHKWWKIFSWDQKNIWRSLKLENFLSKSWLPKLKPATQKLWPSCQLNVYVSLKVISRIYILFHMTQLPWLQPLFSLGMSWCAQYSSSLWVWKEDLVRNNPRFLFLHPEAHQESYRHTILRWMRRKK